MKNRYTVWYGMLAIVFSGVVHAGEATNVLWDKLVAIQSMQAAFKQKVYNKKQVLSQSTGQMAFERPGHFYWKTEEPMKQVLVADGKKFWLYDVELEQVTVRAQSEAMGAAAGLFLGDNKAQLEQDFKVERTVHDAQEIFYLQATSTEANIQRMTLSFKGEGLSSMDLYDQLGQRTDIRFQSIQLNQAISNQLFQFTPPPKVDVVEQ